MSGNNQPNLAGWAAILTGIAAIITAIGFPAFFPDLAKQFFDPDNFESGIVGRDSNSPNNTNPETPDETDNSTNEKTSNSFTLVDHIKYEFNNCKQSSQRIRCTISVTNQALDKNLAIYASNARIIAHGEQYAANSLSFGSQSSFSSYRKTRLVKDIPINLYINFDGINNSLSRIDLLEFAPQSS